MMFPLRVRASSARSHRTARRRSLASRRVHRVGFAAPPQTASALVSDPSVQERSAARGVEDACCLLTRTDIACYGSRIAGREGDHMSKFRCALSVFLLLTWSACGGGSGTCGEAQAACSSSADCCQAFECGASGLCCVSAGSKCRTSEDCCGALLCAGNVCGTVGCSSPDQCGSAEWCLGSAGCLAKCSSDGDCAAYGASMTCQQFPDANSVTRSACALPGSH